MLLCSCEQRVINEGVTNVQWIGGGSVAVVSHTLSNGNENTYKLTCGEDSRWIPFEYAFDCNLDTICKHGLLKWDNPSNLRKGIGSERAQEVGDSFDLGDAALGFVAGSMLSSGVKVKRR